LLVAQGSTPAAPIQAPVRAPVYGVLPTHFLAGNPESAQYPMELLRTGLEARGARFVPPALLEDVLRANRIRQTDSISAKAARTIGEETEIRFLVASTLLSFASAPAPQLAIALHVVDVETGRRVLSSLVSLRGADFKGLLGLGEIVDEDVLALEVAARILEEFDSEGRPAPFEPEDLEDFLPADSLARFNHREFAPLELERVAVLPFINRTNRRNASRLFAEVLGHQWFRTAGIDVVEGSELRAALVRQRVRSLDLLDEELMRRVGEDLGVRYFLLGSVDRFETDSFRHGAFAPEVQASARLLDVSRSRIVAAGSVHRRGDDYHLVLGLGVVKDLTSLADRVGRELVALMGVKE